MGKSQYSKNNDLLSNREVLKSSVNFTGTANAVYPNGDTFNGEFVNGVSSYLYNGCQLRHGSGVYTYGQTPEEREAGILGNTYDGSWENNLKSGIGKQHYEGIGDYYGYW